MRDDALILPLNGNNYLRGANTMNLAAICIGLLLVFLLLLTYALMLVSRHAEDQEKYWRRQLFEKNGGKRT